MSDEASAWRRYLYYGGYGTLSLFLLCLTMMPAFYYNPYVTYDRSFYYINGDVDSFDDQDEITVFIGTRPALDIEFAGYALQYRNEYTLSQQYAGSTKMGKAKPTARSHAYGLLNAIMNTAVSDGKAVLSPCVIRGAGTSRRVKKIKPATLTELADLTSAMPAPYQAMILLAS